MSHGISALPLQALQLSIGERMQGQPARSAIFSNNMDMIMLTVWYRWSSGLRP
ncbi:MAG: hypothetical protein IPN53_08060 [Comamonadaceae bacterium]|nr:hypothetical protein [Comamonadaceae bacterium]